MQRQAPRRAPGQAERRQRLGRRPIGAAAAAAAFGLCCLAAQRGAAFVAGLGRPGAALGARRPRGAPRPRQARPAAAGPGDVTPLSSYLLVRPKDVATQTKGGLLLTTASKDKPNEGEVLSVGPGHVDRESGKRLPVWAEVGKQVLYSRFGAEKVKVGGDELALVRDDEVLLSYDGGEATLENLKMPLGKLLVRLREEAAETEGGLVLSKGAAKPDTKVGEVVAAGEGVRGKDGEILPMEVAVGDSVRFRWGREVKLEVGKDEFRAIDADDCLAKWKE